MRPYIWRLLGLLLAVGLLALGLSVACDNGEEDEDDDTSVTIDIKVLRDDFFDLTKDQVIGAAKFDKSRGQIGLRINSRIFVETLSRFPGQKIGARLELINQDAASEPWEATDWVQDTNIKDIDFVIPLVETIPVYLNFRILLYYYEYDAETAAAGRQLADDDDDNDDNNDDNDDNDDNNDDNDADDDDDDTTDDDTGDDDTPEPSRLFEAEAVFSYLVDKGQPGTGD